MDGNIFKRTSDKLLEWLEWLVDHYGVFGVAAFLIVGTIAVLVLLGATIAFLVGILGDSHGQI